MICGCLLVFLLSFVQLGVLSEIIDIHAECGETERIRIPCSELLICNPNCRVTNMALKKRNTDLPGVEPCGSSEDKKFCFQVSEDGQLTLTVHSVTFADAGTYTLHISRSDDKIQAISIVLSVEGICQPVLSSGDGELTCKVEVNSQDTAQITWMDNENRSYKTENLKHRNSSSLKLTEETKKVQMCCSVSYEKDGKPVKKSCTNTILTSQSKMNQEQDEDTDSKKIIIPILCVMLVLAFSVVLYMKYLRRRHHHQMPKRERTFSGADLIGSEEENPEEEARFPLPRPQNQV